MVGVDEVYAGELVFDEDLAWGEGRCGEVGFEFEGVGVTGFSDYGGLVNSNRVRQVLEMVFGQGGLWNDFLMNTHT